MPRVAAMVLGVVTLMLLLPPAAQAMRTGDTKVVIPVVGRFPGALLSLWRTDVFIGNPTSNSPTVTVTFYVSGGGPLQKTVALAPYSATSLPDIVLNTFGLQSASGMLEVTAASAIEARARIYNAGSAAGQFGQNVPGLGFVYLSQQAFVCGLSGINGNRVNAGVANPNDASISVTLRINDKNNGSLADFVFNVDGHQFVQFNDIFARFGITPQADVQLQFTTASSPIYGFASEVRNDTGDAIFVFGTSPNT